ncbi:winged helix-turn-helix domain-containing protein [Pantoea agglomerans]|uniref:winged helix-turn-helix domain-containing protein n=1 Tax=Enterobacter agglomerans TaxID=549 RepID=UPI0028C3FD90|nr:winged helix-turn-helix domain-containing protein [Pantoea agglomerans]WNN33841.1 winged helix-turn-helix domain-containing protein [Pantoea agglomerans]
MFYAGSLFLSLVENALSRKITLNSFLIFEPDKKRITGRGNPAVISASASLCLELLIDNVGQLVTHQQFYDYVWRRFGTEPASTTLYQNISALRRALNKAGLQEDIIRTMPRKGFLLSPQTTVERESLFSFTSVSTESESAHSLSAGGNEMPEHSLHDERMRNTQNEQKSDSENKISSYSPLTQHPFFSAFFKSKKMMIATFMLFLALFFSSFLYFRSGPNHNDTVFIYSTNYKGCIIFNNADGWLIKDEVKEQVDEMKLNCSIAPYIYLTAFKHADSLSYFNCEHPLNGHVRANCRSYYFVKKLNND